MCFKSHQWTVSAVITISPLLLALCEMIHLTRLVQPWRKKRNELVSAAGPWRLDSVPGLPLFRDLGQNSV